MGMWGYTIYVRGPEQARIVEAVRDWEFDIVVALPERGTTELYIEPIHFSGVAGNAFDGNGHFYHGGVLIDPSQGKNVRDLAERLSQDLNCIVFSTEVLDDDVNVYWFYSNGERRDYYVNRLALIKDDGFLWRRHYPRTTRRKHMAIV